MPIKNVAHEVTFFIWNHYMNAPVTSDTPTIRMRTVTAGSPATITPAASASHNVDATYAPGHWTVAITAGENNVDSATLTVKPSTSYSVALPVTWHNRSVAASDLNTKLDTIDTVVDAILVDTGTTIPGTLTGINTTVAANNTLISTEIADILTDTGTTLPSTLSTISGKVDAVDDLVDTEVAAIKTVVDAILVDTGTTLDGKINTIDGIVDDILVDTAALSEPVDCNVTQISGSATAADNLEAGALTVVSGEVDSSTAPTTTSFKSDTGGLSSTDNFYNGRLVIFTSGTLTNQAREITDYTGATKIFTTEPWTTAPANNNTFIIV